MLSATHAGEHSSVSVATLKPQSPDEKDADKDGRDNGAFRAELLCNRHQLHSNGLRPTHLMAAGELGATGNRMWQQRARPSATSACRFVIAGLTALGQQITGGDALAGSTAIRPSLREFDQLGPRAIWHR
jgi:hypothetical protein